MREKRMRGKRMTDKIILLSAVLLVIAAIITIGIVHKKQIDALSARCSEKISALESTVSVLEASVQSLESTLTQADDGTVTKEEAEKRHWVIVTDYADNSGKTDVSDILQNLINKNPNATIYFPDGVYRIDKPISTHANPTRSVDLHLSNYAVIRAGTTWSSEEAMIRLGGQSAANDISLAGSFYSFTGGIVDGRGLADGISIESGRETAIRNVSIKNTVVGIHIHHGANNGSSDADIYNVNIVGAGGNDSVGVLIEGYDNTLTNLRIANVHRGVHLRASGNMLRNVHPLYYLNSSDYAESCGFYDESGNNWYDYCYSDQFCTGFYIAGNLSNVYDSCFCWWYNGKAGREVAVRTGGKFNSLITSIRVGFHADSTENILLDLGKPGGSGVIQYVLTDESRVTGTDHTAHLAGGVIGK